MQDWRQSLKPCSIKIFIYLSVYLTNKKSTCPRQMLLLTGNFLSSQGVSTQVLSASECLTTVFGMGTGGTIQASSPDIWECSLKTIQKKKWLVANILVNRLSSCFTMWNSLASRCFARSKRFAHSFRCGSLLKSSPRPISIGPLHAFLHFHSRPIYLVVYKGSYQIALWETSS